MARVGGRRSGVGARYYSLASDIRARDLLRDLSSIDFREIVCDTNDCAGRHIRCLGRISDSRLVQVSLGSVFNVQRLGRFRRLWGAHLCYYATRSGVLARCFARLRLGNGTQV